MILRNSRTATTAKFAGTILITALIGAVTAAADDISEVAVSNTDQCPPGKMTLGHLQACTGGEIYAGLGASTR